MSSEKELEMSVFQVPEALIEFIIPERKIPTVVPKNEVECIIEAFNSNAKRSIKTYIIPDYSKCRNSMGGWRGEFHKAGFKTMINCHYQVDPCRPTVDRVCYGCREGFSCKHQRMWVWKP